ncbi:hypothetical protein BWQ96_02348 [Gracilariopsis chorda]|uniref:Uncharacterized protein n=1 Tax=Gracilariopsis chorda TaxID=448386 RepID=A0A2V3J0M1_9FLOR|nr:hypothetical protein BWQ96_02348 [Gracilariopsis chorda]|eukprot:PXF47962.1 hypothetical protein BWQ96_02348 [Gracilariopsis chorda]
MDGSIRSRVLTIKSADLAVSLKYPKPPHNSSYDFNSNNYNNFTFNAFFNSLSKPDFPGAYYDEEGPTIRWILNLLDTGLIHYGSNHSVLVLLQGSLLKSFEDETGAIFYSIHSNRWMFCGWLDLFLNEVYFLRLCAKLTSFGLTDITRIPISKEDYVLQEDMVNMIGVTDRTVNTKAIPDANSRLPNPATRGVIDVNLDDYEDTYERNCLANSHLADQDCHAFCCNSYYVGSPFCTDFPVNCL